MASNREQSLPQMVVNSAGAMRRAILWSAMILYLGLVIRYAWNPNSFAQALAAIGIVGAVVHACFNYGWKNALALLLICLGISFIIENIGTTTGFPFGSYHFVVGADLPHVGKIPLIVGSLWFGVGYLSWIVAATLLDNADRKLSRTFAFFALPLIAAFVMTQWDLVMDPPESTISGAWVWHNGGADFGVPLSNYLGWFFTSWLFFSGFALYFRYAAAPYPLMIEDRSLRAIGILFYAATGLTHLTPYLLGQSGHVIDRSGHTWAIADVRESAVATLLFTMMFTAILAALKLVEKGRSRA